MRNYEPKRTIILKQFARIKYQLPKNPQTTIQTDKSINFLYIKQKQIEVLVVVNIFVREKFSCKAFQ